MAQSNDLPFDLSLLEGELQQEEAPDPLDLIDDCDQVEAAPEELLQDALRRATANPSCFARLFAAGIRVRA